MKFFLHFFSNVIEKFSFCGFMFRLDWNLLSTASPAITAWMNPSNRFAIKLVAMMKAMHLRRTAVAACLMADGLEVQGIQKHAKVI